MGMDAPALEEQTKNMKPLLFIIGFVLVILGITLVLRHWDATVVVFNGVMPAVIAVAGLVVMFAASIKR